MASTPLMTLRSNRQVELVFRDSNPTAQAFSLGAAETLTEAYAGVHTMFQVNRLGTFRSPGIRARRLGRVQYTNRGQTWILYDPQDYWTTVSATGTVLVNNVLAAGDTITINGNVLTGVAVARTPGNNDFQANLANVNLIAAEIEAAINDPLNVFATDVVASSILATVTLTAVTPGSVGNALTLASVTVPAAGTTVSGATLTGGYTMPSDGTTTYLRASEVLVDGTVCPPGPILVVPPAGFFSSPRPALSLQGTAPNVVGTASGIPPVDALHVVLPRFTDNLVITNLSLGDTLMVSVNAGMPELAIAHGETLTLYDAVTSDIYLRGLGTTVDFQVYAAIVQGEMA